MLDRNQLKNQGIRYGRSLQVLFTTVSMFSAEHSSVAPQFQNSFNLLNAILKECGQFTIGFVDNRLLLNNVLTQEKALARLENEFLKRQISAITFPPGLTLSAYKRSIGVLAAAAKVIEEQGGLLPYLDKNPVEMVRVFPAGKNQTRTESGDTLLDTDSESFLMAKAFADAKHAGGALDKLESLLDSATAGGFSEEGGGLGPGAGGGTGGGVEGGGGPGGGSGTGGGGTGGRGRPGGAGNPGDIMTMVEGYLDAQVGAASPPQRSYQELARTIQELRPEFMLSAFPAERREELRSLPPDQMAAEILEDTAVRWAANRLRTAPEGPEAVIVEEEVMRVLLRSLQASQSADRMGRKLAEYLKDIPLPPSMSERIHDELRWAGLPAPQKTERLLEHERWDKVYFRRAVDQLKELVPQGDQENATRLGLHFLKIFDPPGPAPEELGRIPELLRVMAPVRSEFWSRASDRLVQELKNPAANEFHHLQVVNAATALVQTMALYEDFALVLKVGTELETLSRDNEAAHAKCCVRALDTMLTESTVERLLELYLQRREDGGFVRTASKLLQWSVSMGLPRVFQFLEEENVAANRLALLRLIGRLGPEAMALARQQLTSDRWYLVRNACKLLLELKDPLLVEVLEPALLHPDERVQKAAVTAILESRRPGRGVPLAGALTVLAPELLEEVLREITFLKDPQTLSGLRRFLGDDQRNLPAALLVQAVQAVGRMPGDEATDLLAEVLSRQSTDQGVRREALAALRQRPGARQVLERFTSQQTRDHLVREAEEALRQRAAGT